MPITKRVKIEYYRVTYRLPQDLPNQNDRLFDLTQWIDYVTDIGLDERNFPYYQDQVRLDRGNFINDFDLWYLNFLRLRDHIIPSSATLTTVAEPIILADDEYIGEDVVALYDHDNYILAVQRNRFSIGPSGIEQYFNFMWHQRNNNAQEVIYLRPIGGIDALERALHKDTYRKLSIRFADIQPDHLIGAEQSNLRGLLNIFSSYQGLNAEVIISTGRSREGLHAETVQDSLREIDQNRRFFSKVELIARDVDDTQVEAIDLLEDKLCDIAVFKLEDREILRNSMIADEIFRLYIERRLRIINLVMREAQ